MRSLSLENFLKQRNVLKAEGGGAANGLAPVKAPWGVTSQKWEQVEEQEFPSPERKPERLGKPVLITP